MATKYHVGRCQLSPHRQARALRYRQTTCPLHVRESPATSSPAAFVWCKRDHLDTVRGRGGARDQRRTHGCAAARSSSIGARGSALALGPCRPLHGSRGRTADALLDALAPDAGGPDPSYRRELVGTTGRAQRLRLGSGLQPCLQARVRHGAQGLAKRPARHGSRRVRAALPVNRPTGSVPLTCNDLLSDHAQTPAILKLSPDLPIDRGVPPSCIRFIEAR
jgi:hypothetical protein